MAHSSASLQLFAPRVVWATKGRRLATLVAPARVEPGNINYDLHRSNDDPDVWILYENWKACSDLAFRIALHESIPSGVARGARRRNGFEAFFDGHEDRRKGLVPL